MSDLINPALPQNFTIPQSVENQTAELQTPSYVTNGVNALEYTPEFDTFEPTEESHTLRNVGLTVLGATALAALADGIFAKGKHIKKIGNKLKEMFKSKAPKDTPAVKPNNEIKKSAERIRLEEVKTDAGEVLKGNTIFDANGKKLRMIEDLGDGKARITVFDEAGRKKSIYSFDNEGSLVAELDATGKKLKEIKKDVDDKNLAETAYLYNKKGEIIKSTEENFEDGTKKIADYTRHCGITTEKTSVSKDGITSQVKIVSKNLRDEIIRVEEKLESGAIKKTIYDLNGNVKKTSEGTSFSKMGFFRDLFRV